MKKKKSRLIIILSFVAVIFLALNLIWVTYRYNYFVKVVKNNPNCEKINFNIYDLKPERKSIDDCNVGIFFPKYLKFTGNYCISNALYFNTENSGYVKNYDVTLTIKPHLFKEMDFQIQIQDNTENGTEWYTFDINENQEIIKNYRMSPEEILNNSEVKDLLNEVMKVANEYFLSD